MLLMLIAAPVIVLVVFAHSVLQTYAPSNVLVRRVRTSWPTFRMAAAIGVVALGCASAVQAIHDAIEAGAPGWLNLVVLVLAWDAIKFAVVACLILVRCLASAFRGLDRLEGRPDYQQHAALGGSRRESTRASRNRARVPATTEIAPRSPQPSSP